MLLSNLRNQSPALPLQSLDLELLDLVLRVEARKKSIHVAREPSAACGAKKENMYGEVVIRENLEYHETADAAPMIPIGGEGVPLLLWLRCFPANVRGRFVWIVQKKPKVEVVHTVLVVGIEL